MMIEEQIEGKALDYIQGFLDGVRTFAWWKDGKQYVGTTGMQFLDVLNTVEKELDKRIEDKNGDTNTGSDGDVV